jgi:murein L,D-transpeptidase YcbB/YkuD
LIASKQFDRLVPRKADRAGIEAYYSGRNYAPLWVANNAINDRAKSAAAYLAQVDAVGLDPNDYPVPSFKSGGSPDALAEDELKLTLSALTFARHAEIGRIHFTRVGSDIQYDLVPRIRPPSWQSSQTATMPAKFSTATIRPSRNSRR